MIVTYTSCYTQNINKFEIIPIKTIIGYINIEDTICLKEIERAENDVNNNQLKYTLIPIDIDYDKKGTIAIFKNQMQKFQINVDLRESYLAKHNVTLFCYSKYMSKIIETKFGKNFINDNIRKADSLYIIENPNELFKNGDVFDKNLLYPKAKSFKTQYEDCQIDFFNGLKFPKDFIKSESNKTSIYSYAIFTLLKNKKIKDISIETTFKNPNNKKYSSLIEKKLIKFIKSTKWIPKKKYRIEVNSQVLLAFLYK